MKKRTFTLFFAGVFMALTLASCSKDNNDTSEAEATKSVELKIAGLTNPVTKAISNETREAYAAELSSATVIFYSGDNVYSTHTTDANFTIAKLEAGYIFHGIDKRATDVMVVGNQTVTGGTISAIKAQTVAIEDEQIEAVTLIGSSSLGAGEKDYHPVDGGDIVIFHEVNVVIAPLVSRFEIKSIGCSDLGETLTDPELVLNGIGLFNFAEKVTLDGNIDGPIIKIGKYANGYSGNIFPISKPEGIPGDYLWYQFGVDALWSFDWLEDMVLTPAENSVTAGDAKVWTYNFIPEKTTNIILMLQLNGEDLVVRTNGFNGLDEAGFESGKIYQLEYTFLEKNINPFDPDMIVCAEVTVTVKDWEIEILTPVFE